jgi:hypothetical protein
MFVITIAIEGQPLVWHMNEPRLNGVASHFATSLDPAIDRIQDSA